MNEERKIIYFFPPALLAIIMFSSNFLNTNIFNFSELNFTVWFVLSAFAFSLGWLINKTLNWRYGGKTVFAVIIATTLVSLAVILYYSDYFQASKNIVENLILYSLRNIMLGAMGFFGMAISEIFNLQKEVIAKTLKMESYEQLIIDAKKEAALELKEAQLKAEQLLREAEIQTKAVLDRKEDVEKALREFIDIEKELIKKYEENE